MRSDTMLRSPIPGWHIALLLVGFPLAYLVNSFAPWSSALFGHNDRSAWFTFWIAVLILHWVSAGLTVYWVRTSGNPLSAIGLTGSPTRLAIVAATLLVLGAALVYARQTMGPPAGSSPALPAWFTVLYPQTLAERGLWVVVALSAGWCEEVVYRGFGIPALMQRGYRRWHAVALATLAFVFVHGLAGLFGLPIYFGIGLCFAGLFLWRKSLIPGVVIHTLVDLMALFAV